jgi:hypothetical protein
MPTTREPRLPPQPLQIAWHPHNNCLVVLVHGIMSGRYTAWSQAIDLIQRIWAQEQKNALFASYDFYAFGYDSGYFHQPPIEECFPRLRQLIANEKYDSVVLIGHSQGGVAVKLFIIEELLAKRGRELKVDLVFTLDTPHRGPKLWIYPAVIAGGIWKRIPLAGRVPLLRQVGELGRGSKNLKKLRDHWNSTYIPQTPQPPTPTARHIRSWAVSGARPPFFPSKLVVSAKSAFGFAIDTAINLPANEKVAAGFGHGVPAMRAARHEIEQRIKEHDYANVAQAGADLAAAGPAPFAAVLGPHYQPAAPPACEVECWQRRAAAGFPHRPLRKLSMPGVLHRFIGLRLPHP